MIVGIATDCTTWNSITARTASRNRGVTMSVTGIIPGRPYNNTHSDGDDYAMCVSGRLSVTLCIVSWTCVVRQKNINFFQRQAAADRNYERRRARQAASKRRLKLSSSKAAGCEATEAYVSHPPTPSCQDSSFTGGYVARRRTLENEVGFSI